MMKLGLIAAIGLAACSGGHPCDADQTHSNGICFAPDAAIVTTTEDAQAFPHFGDVCAAATECALPTSFCMILPGAEAGYCTAVGCLEDATICPAGWECLDLSVYQPGLPAVCNRVE